jgi:succinoglycan biosynthesis protein ExoM
METPETRHITVCIPTYKRPRMLDRCLGALQNQSTRGFTYSIIVVDNDARQSARQTVEDWRARGCVEIQYALEPVQNISLSRNRAIAESRGDLVAFIDDDEFPEASWLLTMFNACRASSADGVLGPVLPSFSGTPPEWLVKSGLCDRASFPSGTEMTNSKYMRTGNVLVARRLFESCLAPFDPRLGLSGGEDSDFFERMVSAGRRFVWCQEAAVHEEVPEERQTPKYLITRAFIRGVTSADQEPAFGAGTVKSVAALLLYTLSLPVLRIAGYHLFMRYLVRDCDHLAKLLAHCGIRLVGKRMF